MSDDAFEPRLAALILCSDPNIELGALACACGIGEVELSDWLATGAHLGFMGKLSRVSNSRILVLALIRMRAERFRDAELW
jgi:hypothetical protein